MINFSTVQAGDMIAYIGDSMAWCGEYITMRAEDTYVNIEDCPLNLYGKLMIAEFMNDGTPMFFTFDMLDPKEWSLYVEDTEYVTKQGGDDE